MKSKKKPAEVPLEKLAEEALKRSVVEAIAEHKRAGHPIAVWRENRIARESGGLHESQQNGK